MREPDEASTVSPDPESTATSDHPPRQRDGDGRLARFGRAHPALTVAGLATVGLLGGVELAAGVLLGAGMASVIRRRPTDAEGSRAHPRGRIRRLLARRPHDLRELKARARAVALAAAGDLSPPADGQREPRRSDG